MSSKVSERQKRAENREIVKSSKTEIKKRPYNKKNKGIIISENPTFDLNPLFSEIQNLNMAQEQERPICDYSAFRTVGNHSSIRRPTITANNFEIKSMTINMLHRIPFYGLPHEDPILHIDQFIEICSMTKYDNVSDDALRLKLFPWTLMDKAKSWLYSLPANSITTWNELEARFLHKFFPPAKTAKLKNDIITFVQNDQESLYESWERFKELLRKCPHHGFPEWSQISTFYNGLDFSTRQMVDASAGGNLMKKVPSEAYNLLEEIATNAYQYSGFERRKIKEAKAVDEFDMESLSEKVSKNILLHLGKQNQGVNSIQSNFNSVICDFCGGNHKNINCQSENYFANEEINYLNNFQPRQQNNPYSNTYNPGWRNHPNFSWSNNNNQNNNNSNTLPNQNQNNFGRSSYQNQN